MGLPRTPQRRVISEKSSAQVRELMQAVIDSTNGQRNLKLDGYNRRQDRHRTACGHQMWLLPGLRNLIRGIRAARRSADPDLRRDQQPENGRYRIGHSGAGHRDIMNMATPRYSVAPDARPHRPRPPTW